MPVRAEAGDGLQRVAQACLKPDVVYIDGDHNVEGVLRDLKTTLDMFPDATVVGRDCDGEGGRAAVESLAKERNLQYDVNQTAWRIGR